MDVHNYTAAYTGAVLLEDNLNEKTILGGFGIFNVVPYWFEQQLLR